MRKFYYLLFLLVLNNAVHAQLEAAQWYFGKYAHLDFTSGSPVAGSGELTSREGNASISDKCGNVLFYTNGNKVWDRNGNVMPNGFGLYGGWVNDYTVSSSVQSSIIIPNPDEENIFYIFTADSLENSEDHKGICYTVVDMSLNGGNGDVVSTQKNIPLPLNGVQRSFEKITATAKADGLGFWVVTQYLDTFYSFSVDSSGVNHNPVISKVGVSIPDFGWYDPIKLGSGSAEIKISPNGKRLAIAHHMVESVYGNTSPGGLAVYDFDNETGIVSNEVLIHDPYNASEYRMYWGVEFSPNNNVLYATAQGAMISPGRYWSILFQYDLTASSIIDSEYVVKTIPYDVATIGGYAGLQLGLDKRIYISSFNTPSLYTINNPNQVYDPVTGEDPDYQAYSVHLGGYHNGIMKTNGMSLPNFITSFFLPVELPILVNGIELNADGYCPGDEIHFSFEFDRCPDALQNVLWNFGDGTTSTEMNPSHIYEESGTYTVVLSYTYAGQDYTVEVEIVINPLPEFTLIETPVEICTGDSATLEVTTDVENAVNWYDSPTSTTPIFIGNPFTTPNLTTTTNYWVEVISGEGCLSEREEITVEIVPSPELMVETSVSVCYGESTTLTAQTNASTVNWYDSETSTTPIFTGNPFTTPELISDTTYWVQATGGADCESERIAIEIEIVPTPELTLPEILDVCSGETATITVTTTGETVNWYENEFDTEPFHTGETYTTLPLSNSLTLWLEAVDGNCKSEREPITITVNELPEFTLIENPVEICTDSTATFEVITNPTHTVNWYDTESSNIPLFTGSIFTTPELNQSTSYWVAVESEAGCVSERIEVIAEVVSFVPEFSQIPPVCYGETFTLPTESNNGITGTWTPEINNTQTTTYTFIPDEGQCSVENVTMTVEIVPIPELQLPEEDFEGCIGESLTLTITTTGETVNWYENEFDTIPIFTGNPFTTPQLTQTTTYWLEAQTGDCRSDRQPITIIAHPIPEMEDLEDIIICDGDSYEFTAPESFDYYEWTDPNGNIISTEATVILTISGTYQLMAVYEDNPCPVYRNLTVSFSQTPIITEIKSTENSLTVYASGIGPFEYSLDNVFWQSSNVFYNLQPGIYFVYVRDLYGCGTSAGQGAIMGVPNFISPNGDGKNDTWQIKALEAFPNTRLQIFDRYGKQFVDRILSSDFEWDGRYNSQPLPGGSYWYIITFETGEKLTGHISIRH